MAKKESRSILLQPDDESIKHIGLTQGQYAIVDAQDYDSLNAWPWFAVWIPKLRGYYASRHTVKAEGDPRRTLLMHRVILGLEHGDPRVGDHREPSMTIDNRRNNLRIATKSQNQHNRRPNRNSRSPLKGAGWDAANQKYVSSIQGEGKTKHLGRYDTALEAHQAYAVASLEVHKEFSRTA